MQLRNSWWISLTALILNLLFSDVAFAEVRYLQENDPAPFTGILLSLDAANRYRQATIDRDALRISYAASQTRVQELEKKENNHDLLIGVAIGVAVTGLSVYAAKKIFK